MKNVNSSVRRSANYYLRMAYNTIRCVSMSESDDIAQKRMEAVGFLETAASCLYGDKDCDEVNSLKDSFLRLASIYLGYLYALNRGRGVISSAGFFSLLDVCNRKDILNPASAFKRDFDGKTKYLYIDFDNTETSSGIEALAVDLSTYWNNDLYLTPLDIISTALLKSAPADGPFFFYDKYVHRAHFSYDDISKDLNRLLNNPPKDDLITGAIEDSLTDCNTFLKALAFFSTAQYAFKYVWENGYGGFTRLGEDDAEVVKTMRGMFESELRNEYHCRYANTGLPFSFEWLPDKDDPNKLAYCRTGTTPVNSWDMKAKALGIIGY